ncbi:MAG: sel1 repeat family protein [Candidatus Cloacimonetes bacterium]|nr:sel1 repeat family protein [Candidatus Cloacimonadota bacterium]
MNNKPIILDIDIPPFHFHWYKKGYKVEIPVESIISVSTREETETEKKAKQGDIEAQTILGDICFDKFDLKEALYWYEKAAKQGDSKAMVGIAKISFYFSDNDKFDAKAIQWLKKAIKLGNADAMNMLAWNFFTEAETMPKAVYWFKKAANLGNTEAMWHLSDCYFFGEGTSKNSSLGVYWLTKAAEAGMIEAMHDLANCYRDSKGVEYDTEQAFHWYKKAAELGHSSAKKQVKYFKKYRKFNKKIKF